MHFTPLSAAQVEREWPVVEALLAPAIAIDDHPQDVKALLLSGRYQASMISGDDALGIGVTEVLTLDGVTVLWLPYLAGITKMSPKAWLKMARGLMRHYEDCGRAAGCAEIRIGGRDWSRVFPDFERFDDKPNRLRKRL
jgi:hypothetical protein